MKFKNKFNWKIGRDEDSTSYCKVGDFTVYATAIGWSVLLCDKDKQFVTIDGEDFGSDPYFHKNMGNVEFRNTKLEEHKLKAKNALLSFFEHSLSLVE